MAETVGSSFWGLSTFKYANYIDFTGFSFCREKWWNTCFRLACSTPAPVGNVEQEFPSTKWILYISGFSGETKVLSHHPSTKRTFVFLRACFLPGSHSAYMCSCQVPHFVEASGYYNPKSAPKKNGLGALIL